MFEWGTSLIRRYIFLLSFIYWFRPEASGTDQISQKYTDSCYTKIALSKVICNPESGKFLRVESGIFRLRIRNSAQGIRISANDWNSDFKFHWQGIRGLLSKKKGEKRRALFAGLHWARAWHRITNVRSRQVTTNTKTPTQKETWRNPGSQNSRLS